MNQSNPSMTSQLLPDEAGDIDVGEGGHQVLAVESVHDAAVSRDGAGKVLQQSDNGTDVKQTGRGARTQRKYTQNLTFILKARLKPLAKKPPKGPMRDAKEERKMLWIWKG